MALRPPGAVGMAGMKVAHTYMGAGTATSTPHTAAYGTQDKEYGMGAGGDGSSQGEGGTRHSKVASGAAGAQRSNGGRRQCRRDARHKRAAQRSVGAPAAQRSMHA